MIVFALFPVLLTRAYIVKYPSTHCAFVAQAFLNHDPLVQQFEYKIDLSYLSLGGRVQAQIAVLIVAKVLHYSHTVSLRIYV